MTFNWNICLRPANWERWKSKVKIGASFEWEFLCWIGTRGLGVTESEIHSVNTSSGSMNSIENPPKSSIGDSVDWFESCRRLLGQPPKLGVPTVNCLNKIVWEIRKTTVVTAVWLPDSGNQTLDWTRIIQTVICQTSLWWKFSVEAFSETFQKKTFTKNWLNNQLKLFLA